MSKGIRNVFESWHMETEPQELEGWNADKKEQYNFEFLEIICKDEDDSDFVLKYL